MENTTTTHDNLPQMIDLLLQKIEGLEAKINALSPNLSPRTTIDIEAAASLTQKAKSTIYKLARSGGIPSYKRGKKLYFIKEELEQWLTTMPKHSSTTIKCDDELHAPTATARIIKPTRAGRKRTALTL